MKLTVIIPVFNESESIPELLNELEVVLDVYESWEVLFIDDGSSDGSTAFMRTACKKNKNINSIIAYAEASDHPFTFVNLKKKLLFNIFKYKGSIYSDFERTQDWPKAYIGSAALKITKSSYFLKYLHEQSPLFNIKTFDLKKTIGVKISKKENFDINNKDDLIYANQLINKKQ